MKTQFVCAVATACPRSESGHVVNLSRLALLALCVVAVLPTARAQFAIDQIDYYQDGSLAVANSEWAELTVDFTPSSSFQYLNVVIDPGTSNERWAVQNMILAPSSLVGSGPFSTTVQLDLGVARGTDIGSLNIGYSFSNDASGAPGALTNARVDVGNTSNIVNSGVPSGAVGAGALNAGSTPLFPWGGAPVLSDLTWHDKMPNVVQETNYCGPGSAANSLHWLNTINNFGLTQSLTDTMKELAPTMGNNHDGNWDGEEVQGKLKFIRDHNLGVEVHYVGGETLPTVGNYTDPNGNGAARNDGAVTWDWLVNEMRKGQDIEIMTRTHWVVVEGTFSFAGVNLLMYRDDPFQHGAATTAAEKDKINSRHVLTYFDNGFSNIGNGREKLLAMVAESPAVPEPSTYGFAGVVTLLALITVRRRARRS